VFGFSQGACLAAILCSIAFDNTSVYKSIKFKFAIIIAGFKSGQSQHEMYYNSASKLNIPTLHVLGTEDKVIPYDMSLKLSDYFLEPKVYTHNFGHYIPVNAESKAIYDDYLEEMRMKFYPSS
jgi:predicted esterase